MVKNSTHQHAKLICISTILSMLLFCASMGFAQQPDTNKINLRVKPSLVPKTSIIKTTVPNYKLPVILNTYSSVSAPNKTTLPKSDKNLTVSKIYPNPVSDQVNIILRLEKESNLSIKILDMLSNEVLTLSNERATAGEQTKNFTLPKRLNTGIYFIRVIAGNESIVKRISVL